MGESNHLKILVPYGDDVIQIIKKIVGDKAEIIQSDRNAESMFEKGIDASIVTSGRVSGEYIRSAKKLKLIQTFGVGVDKIDSQAILERGDILVCNVRVNAAEVAEYTIMLLLAIAKKIIISDREIRKGDWKYGWYGPTPSIELRKKTCLLIGLGKVGSEIAKRLRGFDLDIYAATRTGLSPNSDLVDKLISIKQVESVLPEADFVILALPLTEESKSLVDEKFLSKMKSSSFLINTARGPIVDEEALYHALRDKKIHGAALDVWWSYPGKWAGAGKYPSDRFPFHELDNVVLSPHRAAYSENMMRAQVEFAGANILRFIRGEQPRNIVDMKLGY
jgi:phosphoglycerate dehydrogenase-like enzyme